MSKVYLVLELAGGGNLYDYVIHKRQLDDAEAALLYAQIVSAVTHMVSILV
jgi:serine/threonine protein kinase